MSSTLIRQRFLKGAMVLILTAMLPLVMVGSGAYAQEPEKKDLNIGIGPDYGTAGHAVIALKKGFFKDEGLNVQLKKFSAGLVQVEALAAGNLDFAVPAQAPVFSLRSAGIPIIILANTAIWNEALALVVRKDVNIKKPTDLYGKKIGLLKGSTAELMWRSIVKEYGLDLKKIKTVHLKPPGQLASLTSGAIDGIVVWQPWVYQAQEKANAEVVHTGGTSAFSQNKGEKVTVDYTRTILTTLEEMARKNPKTVDALIRAYIKAQDFMKDPANTEEVIKIFSEYQGQPIELNRVVIPQLDPSLALDESFLLGMQKPLEFLAQIGRVKRQIDVREYLYSAPLKRQRPELVTIETKFKP